MSWRKSELPDDIVVTNGCDICGNLPDDIVIFDGCDAGGNLPDDIVNNLPDDFKSGDLK